MSAANPIRRRTETQSDHESASTRETLSWRATYTYEANGFRYTDEALLRDVSRHGCAIRGRTSMAVGSKTRVTFYLSDHQRPLSVPARVSWVRGTIFGVEFLQLSHGAYERLQRFIQQRLEEDPQAGAGETPSISTKPRKASLGLAVSLLLMGPLGGCGTLSIPVSSPPSVPFFIPTQEERVNLALRTTELDAVAAECAAENSCEEQVHFSRALVSLFENGEAAQASFEKVIALNPTGALANSSRLWLQLLNDDSHLLSASNRQLLMDFTSHWLRDGMARRIAATPPQEPMPGVAKAALVQALHQKVRERDRHIAQLRAQLDALKIITQEQEDRRKMRPPASLVPKRDTGR